MKSWTTQTDQIVRCILRHPAPLKIILKVKDEVDFLPRWIDHHAAIVGLGNLIVFDNMSSSQEMLDLYRSYEPDLLVVRFRGFHNDIHRVEKYPELYDALRRSCRYFCVLDCDEHLVHIADDYRVSNGPAVLEALAPVEARIIPGLWLENVAGCADRFWYDLKQNHPVAGLRSGKPIIGAQADVTGMLNHNRQVDMRLYDTRFVLNFFVLHMKRLSKSQRIATNIRKLHAHRSFKKPTSLAEILKMDPDSFRVGNRRQWAREIHDLVRTEWRAVDPDSPPARGTVRIVDGRLLFCDAEQKAAFDRFVADPAGQLRHLLDAS